MLNIGFTLAMNTQTNKAVPNQFMKMAKKLKDVYRNRLIVRISIKWRLNRLVIHYYYFF